MGKGLKLLAIIAGILLIGAAVFVAGRMSADTSNSYDTSSEDIPVVIRTNGVV
jgi:hypothetical protein